MLKSCTLKEFKTLRQTFFYRTASGFIQTLIEFTFKCHKKWHYIDDLKLVQRIFIKLLVCVTKILLISHVNHN